jgi:hypothetical protein
MKTTAPRFLAISMLALAIPLQAPAAETTTFRIDSASSYVKAYVFNGWVIDGYVFDGSFYDEWVDNGDGQNYTGAYWRADWTLATFQLGGVFTVETVVSGSNPDWKHLDVVDADLITDAPAYASFSLPYFFSQSGQSVSYSSHPCFDTGFYAPPGQHWSCSGMQMGATRSDEGTLIQGVLDVGGAIYDPLLGLGLASDSLVLPYGAEPDPDQSIGYSYGSGVFEYRMVAVAQVPEPESAVLMLAGLGLVGYVARRRQRKILAGGAYSF